MDKRKKLFLLSSPQRQRDYPMGLRNDILMVQLSMMESEYA